MFHLECLCTHVDMHTHEPIISPRVEIMLKMKVNQTIASTQYLPTIDSVGFLS